MKHSGGMRERGAGQPAEAEGFILKEGSVADLGLLIEPVADAIVPDPEDVATAATILIELDPGISGGHVHDRFDIMIRGRAVSAAPINEIRLVVNARVIGTASFGQPERAAAAVMPDGSPARQRAFQFNLPRPGDGRTERCAFQVVARAVGGFAYAEDFALEIEPTAGDPVTICSGPTRSVLGAARPFAIMYIERGTIDADANLAVRGWAIAVGPILAVQIFAGDECIAKATLGGERGDVASVFRLTRTHDCRVSA